MRVYLFPTWLQDFEEEAGYTVKKLFHETTKSWFVHWVNRHWTHERDEAGDFGFRSLMHMGVGLLNASFILLHWSAVLVFASMFWNYEKNEDLHSSDQAWKDLNGWLVGFAIGSALLLVLGIYDIITPLWVVK